MRIRDDQIRDAPSEADVCARCDADTYAGYKCERQKSTNQAQTFVLPIRECPQIVHDEVTRGRYDSSHRGGQPASLRRNCEDEGHGAQIDQNSCAADDAVLDDTSIEQNLALQPTGDLLLGV